MTCLVEADYCVDVSPLRKLDQPLIEVQLWIPPRRSECLLQFLARMLECIVPISWIGARGGYPDVR